MHNNLGYNYLKINDHIEKAEYHIKEALKKNNQNLYYLDSFGWLLFAKKQLKKAAYVLEKALEIKRNPIILRHFNIVRRYIKK